MRLLHYLEIRNFKRFGDTQRIELDHPAVLIGPNNCGKTTAIQALALWSQAVRAWQEKKGQAPPRERTSTSLNRLSIVSVPVQRTRYFWHNAAVRTGNRDIHLQIKVGMLHDSRVEPVTMTFRNQGEDLVYCTPDPETLAMPEVIATAAATSDRTRGRSSGGATRRPSVSSNASPVSTTARSTTNSPSLTLRRGRDRGRRSFPGRTSTRRSRCTSTPVATTTTTWSTC